MWEVTFSVVRVLAIRALLLNQWESVPAGVHQKVKPKWYLIRLHLQQSVVGYAHIHTRQWWPLTIKVRHHENNTPWVEREVDWGQLPWCETNGRYMAANLPSQRHNDSQVGLGKLKSAPFIPCVISSVDFQSIQALMLLNTDILWQEQPLDKLHMPIIYQYCFRRYIMTHSPHSELHLE